MSGVRHDEWPPRERSFTESEARAYGERKRAERMNADAAASHRRAEAAAAAAEASLRKLNRQQGQPLIDAAVADGRLATAQREPLLRLCESELESVTKLLESRPPDPAQASRNHWNDEMEATYKLRARNLGLADDEVV